MPERYRENGPAAGAEVTVYLWSEGECSSVASVNTRDEFALGSSPEGPEVAGGLLPAGTYTIGIGADGYCPQFLGGAATADDAETFDLAGGEIVTDIELTLTTDCDTTPPQPKPALSLGAGSVRAGGDITVSGTGFAPGEKISFELHSDPIALGALTADTQGALKGKLPHSGHCAGRSPHPRRPERAVRGRGECRTAGHRRFGFGRLWYGGREARVPAPAGSSRIPDPKCRSQQC